MKKFLNLLKKLFSLPPCPDCGGKIKLEQLDPILNMGIYVCMVCGKEWI